MVYWLTYFKKNRVLSPLNLFYKYCMIGLVCIGEIDQQNLKGKIK